MKLVVYITLFFSTFGFSSEVQFLSEDVKPLMSGETKYIGPYVEHEGREYSLVGDMPSVEMIYAGLSAEQYCKRKGHFGLASKNSYKTFYDPNTKSGVFIDVLFPVYSEPYNRSFSTVITEVSCR